jgi:four helix bundle protein
MRDFRDLEVWHYAHKLALAAYSFTKKLPADELYGLTSQIRRAATSIPTNIAEGCGTSTQTELSRFLQIAMRSASELEYLFFLAGSLEYAPDDEVAELVASTVRVKKMLAALIARIRASDRSSSNRTTPASGRLADKLTSRQAPGP